MGGIHLVGDIHHVEDTLQADILAEGNQVVPAGTGQEDSLAEDSVRDDRKSLCHHDDCPCPSHLPFSSNKLNQYLKLQHTVHTYSMSIMP